MRTLVRLIVIVFLLIASLLLVLSAPAVRLVRSFPLDPQRESLVLAAVMALAGMIAVGLAFLLVPVGRPSYVHPAGRSVVYLLWVALLFVLGLILLGLRPSLSAGGAFLLVCLVVFVLLALISRPFGPQYVGPLRLPRSLQRYMHPDETPLCVLQQSRLLEPITPDSLVATNQRLIVNHPTNLGFTSTLEDYNYVDIANVRIERGWIFCTLSMRERFRGDDMVFHKLPKRAGETFVQVVTDQIHKQPESLPGEAAEALRNTAASGR